jgi:hypothetical protein
VMVGNVILWWRWVAANNEGCGCVAEVEGWH